MQSNFEESPLPLHFYALTFMPGMTFLCATQYPLCQDMMTLWTTPIWCNDKATPLYYVINEGPLTFRFKSFFLAKKISLCFCLGVSSFYILYRSNIMLVLYILTSVWVPHRICFVGWKSFFRAFSPFPLFCKFLLHFDAKKGGKGKNDTPKMLVHTQTLICHPVKISKQ